MIRCAISNRSSLCTIPPRQRCPRVECRNTSTICAPCKRSSGAGKLTRDTTIKAKVFRLRLQKTACTSGSKPSNPNKAWGLSAPMPQGPSEKTDAVSAASGPKLGKNIVQIQMEKPKRRPATAPFRVEPRQNKPPNKAGKNCATPAKDTRPIAARAAPPPEMR